MNLDYLPSRSEVMSWNSQTLANYLKKMKLTGCETVVKRSGMNGSKFLTMSDMDIQKFPKVHVPLITKICNNINQDEKKKGLFHRPKQSVHPKQGGFVPTPESWQRHKLEEEEDSEPDYEEVDEPDGHSEDNYICAMSDKHDHDEVEGECEYELPPSEIPSEIPIPCCLSKSLGSSEYIDNIRAVPAKGLTPNPPQRPDSTMPQHAKSQANLLPAKSRRPDSSPQRPITFSSESKPVVSGPRIDRRNKPRSTPFSKRIPGKSDRVNVPTDTELLTLPSSRSTQLISNDQDMDPEWYVRSMSRGDAETSLKQINKTGAFLIRDSSKNAKDQPYTLMVLNEHKVYNIQIRFHGNKEGYSLGTGIKGAEIFPSVKDIVAHHINTPLFIVDAMERGSGGQHQCCLTHPVWR